MNDNTNMAENVTHGITNSVFDFAKYNLSLEFERNNVPKHTQKAYQIARAMAGTAYEEQHAYGQKQIDQFFDELMDNVIEGLTA